MSRNAFVRCGPTGRSRGGGVWGLSIPGLLRASWPGFVVEAAAAEGSGDQYELSVFVSVFFGAFGAAFLVGEVFRGFATELC